MRNTEKRGEKNRAKIGKGRQGSKHVGRQKDKEKQKDLESGKYGETKSIGRRRQSLCMWNCVLRGRG